jgi:putative Mg2+ transporter-C (MgtC) family protein
MSGVLDWILAFPEAHPELRLDLLGGLLLASVLGGAIGWEREQAGKPAGLRTNILIWRLATSFGGPADPGRVAAQIVTGVGFLGAGTIIQTRGTVTGLTTAATLWIVAAIGMAIGFGALIEATGTTLLVLITLIPLRSLEEAAERHQHERDLFHSKSREGDSGA